MCSRHYARWRTGVPLDGAKHARSGYRRIPRPADGRCTVDGCERAYRCGGFCDWHYRRHRAGVPFDKRKRGEPCRAPDCGRVAKGGNGLCEMHRNRERQGIPLDAPARCALPLGSVRPKSGGYMQVKTADGWKAEHRAVMEAELGRALFDDETVHHRNGDRADNRLANLELWSSSHPPGQRVADKLRWARDLLTRYNADTIDQPSPVGCK